MWLRHNEQVLGGQHGNHLGPTGPRWALCWPHELCYLGILKSALLRRYHLKQYIFFGWYTASFSHGLGSLWLKTSLIICGGQSLMIFHLIVFEYIWLIYELILQEQLAWYEKVAYFWIPFATIAKNNNFDDVAWRIACRNAMHRTTCILNNPC